MLYLIPKLHTTASQCVITACSKQPDGAIRERESGGAHDLLSPALLQLQHRSCYSAYVRSVMS